MFGSLDGKCQFFQGERRRILQAPRRRLCPRLLWRCAADCAAGGAVTLERVLQLQQQMRTQPAEEAGMAGAAVRRRVLGATAILHCR